jgi:hypothetical protein
MKYNLVASLQIKAISAECKKRKNAAFRQTSIASLFTELLAGGNLNDFRFWHIRIAL